MIALAQQHPDWTLGFGDEVGGSRLAQPSVHAWQYLAHPVRLIEQRMAAAAPEPIALACYGLLLRQGTAPEDVWLRCVHGRPVSALTILVRDWWCAPVAARGVPVLLVVWNTAS